MNQIDANNPDSEKTSPPDPGVIFFEQLVSIEEKGPLIPHPGSHQAMLPCPQFAPGIEVPKTDEITMEPDLLAAAQFISRKRLPF